MAERKEKVDPKTEAIIAALLARAKAGKHSAFTFLRSYPEYLSAKQYRDSTAEVYKNFKDLHEDLLRTYTALIISGKDNLELLFSYRSLKDVLEFYAKEVEITKDIITEYRCYVLNGHVLDTLLGKYRPDEDLIDVRTVPRKWW